MKHVFLWTAVLTILISVFASSGVFAFTEQRQFIGEEYDAETGLNYLNARYYDSKTGRFTSQDPMFWALPTELLADPQQLNSYSYARNNPIIGSDPSGEKTELGIREVAGIGAHGDIIVTPEKGADFSQYGPGPQYVIAGNPSGNFPNFGNLQVSISSTTINPKDYISIESVNYSDKQITQNQFDESIMRSGSSLSKQDLGLYWPTGRPISSHANSGNAWTQVVLDAGGIVPKIKNNYSGPGALGFNTPHLPLGSGNPINTLSYEQQINSMVVTGFNTVKNSVIQASDYINSKIVSIARSAATSINSTFRSTNHYGY